MKNIIALLFLVVYGSVAAQNITGPSPVNVGDTVQYTFSDGTLYMTINWQTAHGTTYTKWNTGTTYYAKIIWSSPGTASLTVLDQTYQGRGNKSVTVNVGTPVTTFTHVKGCGSSVITRVKNPPSNVTWYWQTSASGTSTTNSLATYTITSSSIYYLRARSGTTWSTASAATSTIPVDAVPPAPTQKIDGNTISNSPAGVGLSITAVGGYSTYNWFTQSTGGTAIAGATSTSYSPIAPANATTPYYVATMNGTCASATRLQVNATVHAEPAISVSDNGQIMYGSPATLTITNAGTVNYSSYQWLDANDNAINGAQSSSYSTLNPQQYKVRVTKGNSAAFTSPGTMIYGQNYVLTNDILIEKSTGDPNTFSVDSGKRAQVINFFDGLGRPIQSVSMKASPLKNDIVQVMQYDAYSREATKYLPFTSTIQNGWIKANALTMQASFYTTGGELPADAAPFAVSKFEASPLNRVIKQGSPGTDWQPDAADDFSSSDHTIKFEYGANDASEVILWTYTQPSGAAPTNITKSGFYPANVLSRTKTKDEQGNQVIDYKDDAGRVVLKKVQAPSGQWAETYYLYDDSGRLSIVLPPEAVVALSN